MKREKKSNYKNKLKNSFLIYTGLFAIVMGFLLFIFIKYNKSFIWSQDGIKQHIVTLTYFRKLLVNFIKTGDISTFTWNIGNGLNLYGNFAFYIFGDIFSYISILFPKSWIENVYGALIIIRIYFVGISFLYFCKYKKMDNYASVIGALMYAFCSYVLLMSIHPYFINPLILFPLAMVGIEKIIVENKTKFYSIIIALLFISSFYFAYIIAVIIAIYGIILAIYTYKAQGAKKIIKKLLQVLLYSLPGILIAGALLLPTCFEFINSERTDSTIYSYSLTYYRYIFGNIISGRKDYYTAIGVSSIILLSLPVFIRKRKENYPIFLLMMVLLVPLLVAQVASVLNGFSYPNNRWSFVISFLFSFITTIFIHNSKNRGIEKNDIIAITVFITIYFFIDWIFEVKLTSLVEIQIIIAVIILLLMINKESIEKRCKKFDLYKLLLMLVFIIDLLVIEYHVYDAETIEKYIEKDTLDEQINTSEESIENFDEAIKYIKNYDDGFYTIMKYPYKYINVSMLLNYKSMGSYYSITPSYYQEMSLDLQNASYKMNFGVAEFNYRTKITTLLGTKYYVTSEDSYVPYGYTKIKEYKSTEGNCTIYENNYSLPFAYLYDSYITEEEYNEMTPLEKESSLLKTTVIQDENIEDASLEHNDNVTEEVESLITEVDYEVTDKNNILQDNKVVVSKSGENSIEIEIGEVKNSEIYLYVSEIEYTPYTKQEMIDLDLAELGEYTKAEQKQIEENYKLYTESYDYTIKAKFNGTTSSKEVLDKKYSTYYFENNEMLLNLGYYEETSGTIKVTFSEMGVYDLSSIQVLAVSMDGYEEDIENLKRSNFETTEYGNGYLSGTVNVEEDGVLQFATIYNKGWKVYVDGEEVDTLISNEYFLGITISSGEHTIYMEYSTPYLKIGIVVSIIGLLMFVGIFYTSRKKEDNR